MQRFEHLRTPLTIVTTDLETGLACYWDGAGDIVEPLIASLSLPGIFPPVALEGHLHIDGGIADSAPISRAASLGFDRMLMIECACANRCQRPPVGLTGILGRAFEIALARKHRADLERHAADLRIIRLVPQLENEPGLLDFSQGEVLLRTAHEQALAKLPELLQVADATAISPPDSETSATTIAAAHAKPGSRGR